MHFEPPLCIMQIAASEVRFVQQGQPHAAGQQQAAGGRQQQQQQQLQQQQQQGQPVNLANAFLQPLQLAVCA